MARKSNKTAHVLNLLAGHDNQPAADETPDTNPSSAPKAASPDTSEPEKPSSVDSEVTVSSAPLQTISVIDTTGEDPVADLIQQKLSAQFEASALDSQNASADASKGEETSAGAADSAVTADSTPIAPAPTVGLADAASQAIITESYTAEATEKPLAADTTSAIAVDTTVDDTAIPDAVDTYSMETASDNVTVPSPEPVPAPAPVSIPTPEPVASVPIPAPESVPGPGPTTVPKEKPKPEPEPEPDFVYVNVMEAIVKDKIIYFMRQFDVCTCERCVADTIALTMNGLMPRYIVASPAAVDPLISFYTNKLISDVTVEATKACITVKDNPRH